MKKLKMKLSRLGYRSGKVMAAFALMLGVVSVEATMCIIFFHQPKVPQGMSKYTKKQGA
ncbi:MAG: cyclic lactone autoinducer peptide [Oscillospiraceae bacterium]|nr:cyclic lactone autoinducer peptide [Oscillospiraceae bacterium]MCL2278824.1 cyclic lactone autoinducer peptide [Oscillospiraceae bacterium]